MVQELLQEVNKEFKSIAIIGTQADMWLRDLNLNGDAFPLAEMIGMEADHYDLIIHAFGLHVLNDPLGQLVQIRHALKPDGLMIAVGLGGQTLNHLRDAFGRAEAAVLGGMSPRVAPMAEIRDLGGLIGRAGLAQPVADNFTQNVEYDNVLKLMLDLRAMGETNVMIDRHKALSRELLMKVFEEYPRNEAGKIIAKFEMIFLTGWKPHESQQQPLRPGSASARLADALGTTESPLKRD